MIVAVIQCLSNILQFNQSKKLIGKMIENLYIVINY